MSYIQNKLDELINTYRKETGFTEYDARMIAERLVDYNHRMVIEIIQKQINDIYEEPEKTEDDISEARVMEEIISLLQDNPASRITPTQQG